MKVSNCCGVSGKGEINLAFNWGGRTYEQYELCPKCGEHCEYIEKENVKHMNQTEQLAREFSLKLRHYLSEHEMSQVISLNESEEDKDCCHSHDFCDANMVMDEAFIKVFNRSCIFPSDVEENPELAAKEVEDLDLWNAAWTVAKNNKFYQ